MYPSHRAALRISILLLAAGISVGCDSGGGDTEDPTGSLSGIIREDGTQTGLASVSVQLGSAQTTTDQNGHYTFGQFPTGQSLLLQAKVTGFDNFTANVVLQAGNNSRDIAMVRKRYYTFDSETGGFGVYLPAGVSTFKGAVFLVGPPQDEVDTRGFASGRATTADPTFAAYTAALRERMLQLAGEHGLALMGAKVVNETRFSSTSFNNVLKALEQVADESGRPGLAGVPLLLMGHSRGGCYAYAFALARSERTAGFFTSKGNCHIVGDAGGAKSVPGYFFIGATDEAARAENITQVFEPNRSTGALWALATEPGAGHTPITDLDLIADWTDAVLTSRLPVGDPPAGIIQLRSIDPATGWLGDRGTRSIAQYAAFEGDKEQAAWLPTMQSAEDWQAFVSATPPL